MDRLSSWIDSKQSKGLYYFTKEEALNNLNLTKSAFQLALNRLVVKNRISRIRSGFYIIVPLEYSETGMIPPEWFINDLMAYLNAPYYLCLLSASAQHGSAHQQPQQYQVASSKLIKAIKLKNITIKFYYRTRFVEDFIIKKKVQTGYINVSNPEYTAIDLIHFSNKIGGLDRVATVFKDIPTILNKSKLLKAVEAEGDIACAQRLGWLLEKESGQQYGSLAAWIKKRDPFYIKLDPSLTSRGSLKDTRWRLWINSDIESDV